MLLIIGNTEDDIRPVVISSLNCVQFPNVADIFFKLVSISML